MKRPVSKPYTITTLFGVRDKYALFGRHSGVDYAGAYGKKIYSPTSGTLTNIRSKTGGNMVVIKDGTITHRLMHNSSFMRANGQVNEGHVVALMGSTGLSTGNHVHWDINTQGVYPTSFRAFISPAEWLQGNSNKVSKGDEMFRTDAEVKEAYLLLRGNTATANERRGWLGQSKQRFFRVAKAEADAYRKQLADVKKALTTANNRPPKTVIKEVIKIVEKPVEKIVTVEVVKTVEKKLNWKNVIQFIIGKLNKLRRK